MWCSGSGVVLFVSILDIRLLPYFALGITENEFYVLLENFTEYGI